MNLSAKNILLCFVLYFALIIAFACIVHPVPDSYRSSPELDDYTQAMGWFAESKFVHDPYRPSFYPVVGAAVMRLTGVSSFIAGQSVAIFSLLLILISTFAIAKMLFSREVALLAVFVTALNALTIVVGVRVATDGLFAGLALCTIALTLKAYRARQLKYLMFASATFALCYVTRYTAVFFAPAIMLAWWKLPKRVLSAVVCSLVFLIVASPQLAFNYQASGGNPFYNKNYQNIAYKTFRYEGVDINSYFQTYTKEDFKRDLRAHPEKIVTSTLASAAEFLKEFIKIIGGPVILLLILFSLYFCVRKRKNHEQRIVLTMAGVYLVGILVTFLPIDRYLVIVMVVSNIYLAYWTFRWMSGEVRNKYAKIIAVVAVLSFAGYQIKPLYRFIVHQPVNEYREVSKLVKKYGSGISVVGVIPQLDRRFPIQYRYVYVNDGLSDERAFQKLKEDLEKEPPQFIVVGRKTLYAEPTSPAVSSPELAQRLGNYTLESSDNNVLIFKNTKSL